MARTRPGIEIERLRGIPVSSQRVEIVERKGIGHPDTICDEVMEAAAVRLAAEYRRRFGRMLHFNLDKAFLVAGRSAPTFGGGRVEEPMKLVVGDRATRRHQGQEIPVGNLVAGAARDWLRSHIRNLDADSVVVQDEIKPAAAELAGLFEADEPGANDTSAGAAYAPLSPSEKATLQLERFVDSGEFRREFPEAGEDVKVMLVRRRDRIEATLAVAFVDRHITDVTDYVRKKTAMREALTVHLRELAPWATHVDVTLNALDNPAKGPDGLYLTVTGTSAEAGDSGEVGRGNRPNGVISVNRPMSAEAVPGKNPASHVGKVYNLLAQRIADRIHTEHAVEEAYVRLVSRIGSPLAKPHLVSLQILPKRGVKWTATSRIARSVVQEELESLPEFLKGLERK